MNDPSWDCVHMQRRDSMRRPSASTDMVVYAELEAKRVGEKELKRFANPGN